MNTSPVIWLGAIALAVGASTVVVALGCYLLRSPVQDLSNSTTFFSHVLRLWRMAPGLILCVFGCFLLLRIVQRILVLSLPSW